MKCIGMIDTSVQGLIDYKIYDIKAPNGGKGQGKMNFKKFELVERPSFVEYLRSGWQISLTLAIDFTASNGNYSEPQSLHFLGSRGMN